MNLPVRVETEPGPDPVISVDGAWGAKGLNLSHWPGNGTPPDLKHDLSTGIALNFSKLDAADQEERARGCVAICNNHYDTDGMCSLYALVHPEDALERESLLLDAARAGDFFQLPSERAFVTDCIVAGLCDAERSPWRSRFEGTTDRERYEICTHALLERFGTVLTGEVDEFAELWQPRLAALQADREDLAGAALDDLVHLSLCVWTAPAGAQSRRAGGPACFDPGRHALFGTRAADRHLVVGPGERPGDGTSYRFVVGTLSWFDLVSTAPPPRPDLEALAAELNRLEGVSATEESAWRHQSPSGASPELWFGREEFPSFSEHAEVVLMRSALDSTRVKAAVVDALRSAWVFPDEDGDGDDD